MMKLISSKICPFVQRVVATLEAKNINYDLEYISLKNKPNWFLEILPLAQVPALIIDNKIALFDTKAIIQYIEDNFGKLNHINNEQNALENAWANYANNNYLTQCSFMSSKTKEVFNERLVKIKKIIKIIEQAKINNKKFFKADYICKVDLAWLVIFQRFEIVKKHTKFNILLDHIKLQEWSENLLNTNIAKKSVAKDFEEIFSKFYLTNNYLGNLIK